MKIFGKSFLYKFVVVMGLVGFGLQGVADESATALSRQQLDMFRETAKDLRCPTCQGLSILESEATFSVQMKNVVKDKIREGMAKEQILDFFMERYGPWILRKPPVSGVNALAWILPVGTMILGPIFIWLFVWRRRSESNSGGVRSRQDIVNEFKEALAQKGIS
jgi:cytochrome c-type biogenesis protein CcmH/NrfF